eukprot:4471972-Ditylum_brightwellii.AAC.1
MSGPIQFHKETMWHHYVRAVGTNVDADVFVRSDEFWSAVRAQMYGEEIKCSLKDLKKGRGVCTVDTLTLL